MSKFFKYAFAVAGTVTPVPNDTQLSGSVSYQQGYPIDYTLPYDSNPNAKPVDMPSFNQLLNDITSALQEWQTQAIPDFITAADNDENPWPYTAHALVRYTDTGVTDIYASLADNNTTLPTDTTKWQKVTGGEGFGQPVGSFLWYAGTVLPDGYLACNGAAVSRTIYAALFAAIGTTWGAGDGSTTFNLPPSARMTLVGSGGTATAILGNTVGSIGGEEAHQQTESEIASHNHTTTFITSGGSGSSHTLQSAAAGGSTTINTDIAGSSTPFNVMQPSMVGMLCIKY